MGIRRTRITRTQTANKFGEVSFTETSESIAVATNPLSQKDPRFAVLQQGNTRIEDARVFFTTVKIELDPPDHLRWDNQLWIAHSTADYGGHSESVFVRAEVQS